MGFEWPALVARLRGVADYDGEFGAAYRGGVSKESIIDAIVSFERTLLTPNAPFDRYLRGDEARAVGRGEETDIAASRPTGARPATRA